MKKAMVTAAVAAVVDIAQVSASVFVYCRSLTSVSLFADFRLLISSLTDSLL